MLMEFGRAGWIGKARQQPEKVRQALQKVRTDGALSQGHLVLRGNTAHAERCLPATMPA